MTHGIVRACLLHTTQDYNNTILFGMIHYVYSIRANKTVYWLIELFGKCVCVAE